MIEKAAPTRERIEWLDSIRGLAALTVLFSHLSILATPPAVFDAIASFPVISALRDGRTAVTMFFVLSGFVLALPYARPRASGASREMAVNSFYLRRIARIWCPWFVAFCLSAVAKITIFKEFPSPLSRDPAWLPNLHWQFHFAWPDMLRQLVFAFPGERLIGQDWSLQLEMIWSALLPVMLWLLRKNSWTLAAATALAFATYHNAYLYLPFVAGLLIARYSAELAEFFRRIAKPVQWSFFALALLLYNVRYLWGFSLYHDRWKWCGATIGCALLVIACLGSKRLQTILSKPLFVFFGRISFSLYLLQHIVIFCALPPWALLCSRLGFTNYNFLFFSCFVVGTILSILIAVPGYYWVEVPFMNLGKAISARLEYRGKRSRPAEIALDASERTVP